MEIISVTGVVVHSVKYKENSKILNILTKTHGIIGVIAKGALKDKSSLRVVSENFTYANFQIYYKEGKLSTLIEADVIDYFMNIKTDIEKLGYLNYLTELTRDVCKENYNSDIYDIYINAILKIEEGFNPKIITNIVEIKYLNYLGVGLNLNGCSVCGKNNIVTISLNKGGYVCAFHHAGEPILKEASLKMFKAYLYVDISKISELKIKDDVVKEIDEFLNVYYKEYTGLYLKSKNFLNNIKSN